jgi:sortase (surface protein transpeptidase)
LPLYGKGVERRVRITWISTSLVLLLVLAGCTAGQESAPTLPSREEAKEGESTASTRTQSLQQGIRPARFEIPSLSIAAKVEPVSTNEKGEMDVPKDPDDVAWYEPGFNPGAAGNAVIAGHVDSKEGPAVFYPLRKLKAGDEVKVIDEQGKTLTFVVTGKESYPWNQAPIEQIFGSSAQPKLNLITCSGPYDRANRNYPERLVVFTELKE